MAQLLKKHTGKGKDWETGRRGGRGSCGQDAINDRKRRKEGRKKKKERRKKIERKSALPEHSSLTSAPHIRWLVSICESSFRDLLPLTFVNTHATHTHHKSLK